MKAKDMTTAERLITLPDLIEFASNAETSEKAYYIWGVIAQLKMNYSDDFAVSPATIHELLENFPPVPVVRLETEIPIRYVIVADGVTIDEFPTLEMAKAELRNWEYNEKQDKTYSPDFYQIIEWSSGEVVK